MKLLLLFICLSELKAETLNEALKPLFYKSKLGHAVLSKKTIFNEKNKYFYNFKFTENALQYDWELTAPVDEKDFKKHQRNVFSVIKLSYQDRPTPYGGEITNLSHCSEKFQPSVKVINKNGKNILMMTSFVDQNFNHGICKVELKKYLNCTSYYYNKKRKLKCV